MVYVNCEQNVNLYCEFSVITHNPLGSYYTCIGNIENTENPTFIEELQGAHLNGKSNADVAVFYERNSFLRFIPSNLADIFPNLRAIVIFGPLRQIVSNDFKPFPDLLWFYSTGARVTSIDGDLFQPTPKIMWAQIIDGKLENVGRNILDGLEDLKWADFRRNTCINFSGESPEVIEELKEKLLVQCPPLEPMTTTTTTTEANVDCPLRCSLENEVDELQKKTEEQSKIISEMQKIIDDFKENNEMQEERLVELEKLVREIGSRP